MTIYLGKIILADSITQKRTDKSYSPHNRCCGSPINAVLTAYFSLFNFPPNHLSLLPPKTTKMSALYKESQPLLFSEFTDLRETSQQQQVNN